MTDPFAAARTGHLGCRHRSKGLTLYTALYAALREIPASGSGEDALGDQAR